MPQETKLSPVSAINGLMYSYLLKLYGTKFVLSVGLLLLLLFFLI